MLAVIPPESGRTTVVLVLPVTGSTSWKFGDPPADETRAARWDSRACRASPTGSSTCAGGPFTTTTPGTPSLLPSGGATNVGRAGLSSVWSWVRTPPYWLVTVTSTGWRRSGDAVSWRTSRSDGPVRCVVHSRGPVWMHGCTTVVVGAGPVAPSSRGQVTVVVVVSPGTGSVSWRSTSARSTALSTMARVGAEIGGGAT